MAYKLDKLTINLTVLQRPSPTKKYVYFCDHVEKQLFINHCILKIPTSLIHLDIFPWWTDNTAWSWLDPFHSREFYNVNISVLTSWQCGHWSRFSNANTKAKLLPLQLMQINPKETNWMRANCNTKTILRCVLSIWCI